MTYEGRKKGGVVAPCRRNSRTWRRGWVPMSDEYVDCCVNLERGSRPAEWNWRLGRWGEAASGVDKAKARCVDNTSVLADKLGPRGSSSRWSQQRWCVNRFGNQGHSFACFACLVKSMPYVTPRVVEETDGCFQDVQWCYSSTVAWKAIIVFDVYVESDRCGAQRYQEDVIS